MKIKTSYFSCVFFYKIRLVLSGTIRSSSTMSFKYPEVRRDETVKDNYFGIEVTDPYRWLEDPNSEETKAFVDAQNAITKPFLDACRYKDNIKSKVTDLWNYAKIGIPFRFGDTYFQFRNSGLQNQNVLYILDSYDSEGEVFLDPNTFSEDGTMALSGKSLSEDGRTLAYGLSASGSDWIEIKFKHVDGCNKYNEVLRKVKYSSMSWMHDNEGFFYGAYLEQTGTTDGSDTKLSENQKLYYHKLGTDQSNDILVVELEDPQLFMSANVSHCGTYLIIYLRKGTKTNMVYFTKFEPFMKITGKFVLTPVVTEFEADYTYISNINNKFFFRTNKNAANYKVIIIDFDEPAECNWVDLIPEHPKDVLEWASVINNDMLVVCYLSDVKHEMSIYDLKTSKKIYDFHLDVGTISKFSGKPYHTEMFYSFCSFLTPNIIHKVNFDGNKITDTIIHETKVGDFDSSLYETDQVFYKSKDGTDIPMFIVSKKDFVKDGSKPCWLYGYGGFNVNLTPSFEVSLLVFMNNFEGIFALANIRGGGEYGDRWHNGGRLDKKQNCFDDFQHAAKCLIAEKYTAANKLIINGRSNGGLLVATCATQAPQLFGAVICQVGVLDMLRYHKFTIGYAWKSDYGCSEEEDQFKYIYKYSPLHNIHIPEDGEQYPAMLILTADHDDRVVPLHSLKFTAELQSKIGKLPSQKNPLLIHIETRAGHGRGKPTTKKIEEVTNMFCFISQTLNLEFKDC